ncbi:MAG TPA: hypothetical protein EYP85_00925 [Armatimonadetes bacterium]|nr:hypothetical protein [Armatimonadota bacterium]
MKLCRFYDPQEGTRIGLVLGEQVYDLTGRDPERFGSLLQWLCLPDPFAAVAEWEERGLGGASFRLADLDVPPAPEVPHLLAPLDEQEVWGAGVTYLRSKVARMEESEQAADAYDRVYEAARPELFFKATPHRVVGPNAPLRLRADSQWNVPEPELTLVLTPSLQLVGFTAGNDLSSRDIEGENPLYLPQAKIYLECCSLGPVITLAETVSHPEDLSIRLTVRRNGEEAFAAETSTRQMKRPFANLIEYLGRDNAFPRGVFLLTGTGIVPPREFTLQPGDLIEIVLEEIGVLRNPVHRSTQPSGG